MYMQKADCRTLLPEMLQQQGIIRAFADKQQLGKMDSNIIWTNRIPWRKIEWQEQQKEIA